MAENQKLPSREMVDGPSRAPERAMLHAAGFDASALAKPMVAIVHSYSNVTPCNMHMRDLAAHAAEGIRAAGATPVEFNTIVVTDGIAMGTDGMRFSLQSREIIADSIETVTCAQFHDACITIPGCDKNMPGVAIGMARHNRPSVMIFGGSIKPGYSELLKKPINYASAVEAKGAFIYDTLFNPDNKDQTKEEVGEERRLYQHPQYGE